MIECSDARVSSVANTRRLALAHYVKQEGWFFAGWYPEDIEIIEKDPWPAFLGIS